MAFFGEALERYHGQHRMAQVTKEKRSIGMLLVDATKMKNLLIPSPLRCLDVSSVNLFITTPEFCNTGSVGIGIKLLENYFTQSYLTCIVALTSSWDCYTVLDINKI